MTLTPFSFCAGTLRGTRARIRRLCTASLRDSRCSSYTLCARGPAHSAAAARAAPLRQHEQLPHRRRKLLGLARSRILRAAVSTVARARPDALARWLWLARANDAHRDEIRGENPSSRAGRRSELGRSTRASPYRTRER